MRILILGGSGMLGHQLWRVLRNRFSSWITVRTAYADYETDGLFDPERTLGGIDVTDFDSVERAFAVVRPEAVINAVGIIKQQPLANDPVAMIAVNSIFPHQLASLCRVSACRLIHISTDCVFSGRKGMCVEDDQPDPSDLYGRSKLLGEVAGPNGLTLRTSVIGRELRTSYGLVEWLLANRSGNVDGYQRAIYTGLTTRALARVIEGVLIDYPRLKGIWQVSSDPISKYELLCIIREAFDLKVNIRPDSLVQIDRSLDSRSFRQLTGYEPPTWPQMIWELAEDITMYETIRRTYVCRR